MLGEMLLTVSVSAGKGSGAGAAAWLCVAPMAKIVAIALCVVNDCKDTSLSFIRICLHRKK
jgi:hypothetical protein